MSLDSLKVKVFADGANLDDMINTYRTQPFVKGFTTNPTLMNKAGIRDYEGFAKQVLAAIPDRSISFEVFSDDFAEMERQANYIASWGKNVYVKIPVTDSKGNSSVDLVRRLAAAGVKQNVTALMTLAQVHDVTQALAGGPSSYISVFAGRIADTGIDPVPVMQAALAIMSSQPQLELIWASPREAFNIIQADTIGCHIITVTKDQIAKAASFGKNLDEFSLETVQMFRTDSVAAGFTLAV
jgi:transaldolase